MDDDQVCRSCGRAREGHFGPNKDYCDAVYRGPPRQVNFPDRDLEAWRGLSLTHSMSEQDPKATARCICPCGKSIDEHTPPDYLCYANYFALRNAFEPAGLNSISTWATEGFFSSTCRLCENAKDLHERSPRGNLLCPGQAEVLQGATYSTEERIIKASKRGKARKRKAVSGSGPGRPEGLTVTR